MPGRKFPLITGEIYHVFNRGIDKRETFTDKREYRRAIDTCHFYMYAKPPISFSRYVRLEAEKRREVNKILASSKKHVELLCFAFMPNHFHLLVKQIEEGGISKFLSNFQNSHTRYFNGKHDRDGSLFLDQFKCVRIEDDKQLVHVSRYIHLNPHTGYVLKNIEELTTYPWTSLPLYLQEEKSFLSVDIILGIFRNVQAYRSFVFNQADYQRELKRIEHLTLD